MRKSGGSSNISKNLKWGVPLLLLISWGQFHQCVHVQLLCTQIPKAQKDSQVKQLFALLGSPCVKAARKQVDEFDPTCQIHHDFVSTSRFQQLLCSIQQCFSTLSLSRGTLGQPSQYLAAPQDAKTSLKFKTDGNADSISRHPS